MTEIIAVSKRLINGSEVNSVNAREIHQYLGVKTKFSMWIDRAIKKYDFVENIDYTKITLPKNGNGGKFVPTEYIVTLDMAKELAMLENNPKGKETRKYFISVEKKYQDEHSAIAPAIMMMGKALETIVTQNQTILTLLEKNLEPKKIDITQEYNFVDKPKARMMKRRLSNEDKFIEKVIQTLRQEEGLNQSQLLERAGYYRTHKTARTWLEAYDGIYWRGVPSMVDDRQFSFSLIEEAV